MTSPAMSNMCVHCSRIGNYTDILIEGDAEMVKIVLQPADDRAIILAPQVDQSSGQPANPSGPILTFAPHVG